MVFTFLFRPSKLHTTYFENTFSKILITSERYIRLRSQLLTSESTHSVSIRHEGTRHATEAIFPVQCALSRKSTTVCGSLP